MAGEERAKALAEAIQALDEGHLLGLTAVGEVHQKEAKTLFQDLQAMKPAIVLPVYCSTFSTLPPLTEEMAASIRATRGLSSVFRSGLMPRSRRSAKLSRV